MQSADRLLAEREIARGLCSKPSAPRSCTILGLGCRLETPTRPSVDAASRALVLGMLPVFLGLSERGIGRAHYDERLTLEVLLRRAVDLRAFAKLLLSKLRTGGAA